LINKNNFYHSNTHTCVRTLSENPRGGSHPLGCSALSFFVSPTTTFSPQVVSVLERISWDEVWDQGWIATRVTLRRSSL